MQLYKHNVAHTVQVKSSQTCTWNNAFRGTEATPGFKHALEDSISTSYKRKLNASSRGEGGSSAADTVSLRKSKKTRRKRVEFSGVLAGRCVHEQI